MSTDHLDMRSAHTQPMRPVHSDILTEESVIIPRHSTQAITIKAPSFSIIFLAIISALICWTGLVMILVMFILKAYLPDPAPEPTVKDTSSCASSCSPLVSVSWLR